MIRGGHPGFDAHGGSPAAAILPIVFAGLLPDDPVLANINKSFPKASFGEDEQTADRDCWTGAKVVFTGHSAIEQADGVGLLRGQQLGPLRAHPALSGDRAITPASPIAAAARASPGSPRPWRCG